MGYEPDSGSLSEGAPASEAEVGDALLALVAVARAKGWDAERALRERLRALATEIRAAEASAGSADSADSGGSGPESA